MVVEAELRRRRASAPEGPTVPWLLTDDGLDPVADTYLGGEVLADQAGAGAVLDFEFAAPVDLLWVRADGGDARAEPFGGDPAANFGIVCEDGIPNPLTIRTDTVKVFAGVGTTVHVWGYRYAAP